MPPPSSGSPPPSMRRASHRQPMPSTAAATPASSGRGRRGPSAGRATIAAPTTPRSGWRPAPPRARAARRRRVCRPGRRSGRRRASAQVPRQLADAQHLDHRLGDVGCEAELVAQRRPRQAAETLAQDGGRRQRPQRDPAAAPSGARRAGQTRPATRRRRGRGRARRRESARACRAAAAGCRPRRSSTSGAGRPRRASATSATEPARSTQQHEDAPFVGVRQRHGPPDDHVAADGGRQQLDRRRDEHHAGGGERDESRVSLRARRGRERAATG